MKRFLAALFPPRGRHRERRTEGVSLGVRMDNADARFAPGGTWYWPSIHNCPGCGQDCDCTDAQRGNCPDADPAAPTVLLRPVLDAGVWDGPAIDVHWTANRQPTPAPSTTDGAVTTMEHVGADETAFPALLADMRIDLADDSGSLDPDDIAWEQEFDELDRRLADVHMAFVRRWAAEVEPLAERVAPGWRTLPRVAVRDFEEAMTLAGVHVMPAVPVDWSTAAWPVVEVPA